MESMTPEQREKFIEQRVKDILKAFEDFHADLSTLSLDERDRFIQNRAVQDLAVSDAITAKTKAYVRVRDVNWKWLTLMDVIALMTFIGGLVAFIGLAINDRKDVIVFVVIAIAFVITLVVMVINRIVNHNSLVQLHALLKFHESHLYHESDTAALLFLINGIDIVEKKILGNGQ